MSLLQKRKYKQVDPQQYDQGDFIIKKQPTLDGLVQRAWRIQLPEENKQEEEIKENKKKRKPVGVYKSNQVEVNEQTVAQYFEGLQQYINDDEAPHIEMTGSHYVDDVQERVKLSHAIMFRVGNGQPTSLTLTVNQLKTILVNIKESVYQKTGQNVQFNMKDAKDLVMGDDYEDENFIQDFMYNKMNFGASTERVYSLFLGSVIASNQQYWDNFVARANEDIQFDLFQFLNASDSLRRVVNFEAPSRENGVMMLTQRDNNQIPEYSTFLKFVVNILQIPVDRAYLEYQTMFQPNTNPSQWGGVGSKPIIQDGFMTNRDKFTQYLQEKVSMERFAGALSVSKKHCIITLWYILKFIEWTKTQQWYIPNSQHIYERIFIPQKYDDISVPPTHARGVTPFYGIGSYFLVQVVHSMNIARQNLLTVDDYEYLYMRSANLAPLLPFPGVYNLPEDKFELKEGKQGVLNDFVVKARVPQALDTSNFMGYRFVYPAVIKDYSIDNVNLECLRGLIRAFQSNMVLIESGAFDQRERTHYITFIMRIPILQYKPNPQDEIQDPQDGMREAVVGDVEYQGQEINAGTHYVHRTGNFVLSDIQVNRLLNNTDQNINELFRYVLEVIKDQFDQLCEDYGWTEEEYDFSRMQITQYHVFSVPNQIFRLKIPDHSALYESEGGIRFYGRAHSLTPILQQKYYYKPAEDYLQSDLLNCVYSTFAYIWLKIHGHDTTQINNYNLTYPSSQFYKKNKRSLIFNDIFINLDIFKKQLCEEIQLILPESGMMYYDKLQEPRFIIKFALDHCWIDREGLQKFVSKKQFEKTVYKLCPTEKKKRDNKVSQILLTKIFYDIETVSVESRIKRSYGEIDSFLQVPCLLCAEIQYKEEVHKIHYWGQFCVLAFVQFIYELRMKDKEQQNEEGDRKYLIFAHNGNSFDHLFLFPILLKLFAGQIQFAGSASHLKFLKVDEDITFVDTRDLMPGSLADLGEQFQTEHRKLKFDVEKITYEELESEEYKQNLLKYCEIDVTVLREVYNKFVSTLKAVVPITEQDVKCTIASTALNLFRKFFLPKEIQQIYGNKPDYQGYRITQFERISYYGGVCQVWNYNRVTPGSLFYDFVSMYPSILSSEDYPIDQGSFVGGKQKINNKKFIMSGTLYVLSQFKFNKESITPNLPVRNPKSHVSIYCLEWNKSEEIPYLVYWGDELILAFEKLQLESIEIIGYIVYQSKAKLFEKYVNAFFKVKKESEEGPLRSIAKIFLNSLYGKFGQLPTNKKKIISKKELIVSGVEGLNQENMSNKTMKQMIQQQSSEQVRFIRQLDKEFVEVEYSPNELQTNFCGSLVRLASYTTMKGRCKLFQLIASLYEQNVRVYYCDTDSVCCDPWKEQGNIAPQFKEDCQIIDGEFIAPKCYYLRLNNEYKKGKKDYIRCKGIIAPTIEALQKLSEEGENKIDQKRWERKFGGVEITTEIKKLIIKPKRIKNINLSTSPFLHYFDFI